MIKPTTTAAVPAGTHTKASQLGLDLVSRPVDQAFKDDAIIQALADTIATGDRAKIVESAKRLVGHETANSNPIIRLLCVGEIAMILGISTRSVWRLVARGDLPQPVQVGSARRWFESDVTAYLAKQTAKRDAKFGKSPRSLAA